ncbi:Cytochrome P450 76C2 [Linum grandiflorum]
MLTGLLCLLAILAILFRFPSNQTPAAAAKLPPGPSRLPIIGNLHNLLAGDKLPHQSLAHLAQIHGPLMSLKLGQQVVTIVASSPAIGVDLSDQDLFAGGIDTMTSTVEWAMAEMLRNPLIFAKARDAIIKETFRLHPASPLLIPRNASADVEICGFTVPKGAQILVNLWAMGRDPDIWNNPTSFMPERFMGSEIDFRGSSFELIPFGGGRRICPGLPWVMRMLPLILGSLVHEFDWTSKDGVELGSLDMKEKFGITLQKAKPLFVVPMHR